MARYIDADAFEKYLNREEWETPDEKWWPEREIGMILDVIPTADVVEVVHGEWKWTGSNNLRCSECGEIAPTSYNFCPDCGADMRGNIE